MGGCDLVVALIRTCWWLVAGSLSEETGRNHPGNEGHVPRHGLVPLPSQLRPQGILQAEAGESQQRGELNEYKITDTKAACGPAASLACVF